MTAAEFHTLVLALWGEHWHAGIAGLLAKHGHRYTRQSYFNWRKGVRPVPEPVAVILKRETKKKGIPA